MARSGPLLTEAQWNKIAPLLPKPPKQRKGGRPWVENRRVLEGILWILRSGARWQDLPEKFPHPSTCWRRLRDWEERGVWLEIWRTFLSELNDRCASCKVAVCTEELIKAAQKGRLAAHTAQAEAKRGESRRQHAAALRAWRPSNQAAWLTEETYVRKIQPRLADVTVPAIRAAIGVSKSYATNIRSGKRLPHPRHWQTLARLVGKLNG